MEYILNTIYLLAAILVAPKALYRAFKQGRYRTGWAQRFGRIDRKHPEKPCIWIHAVSVGEVNQTRKLITDLTDRFPDHEIVISTTTDTGHARAQKLYADDHTVFFYPLDFSPFVRRAFKNLNPSACLLIELEVWPNFAAIAHKKHIPVIVVNGRLSDKSYPVYKKIKPAARWMFRKLELILAQTDEYAQRFIALGCDPQKVRVTSSLKYDTAQIADKLPGSDELAKQIDLGDEPFWVVGNTGPDEEWIALDIFTELRTHPDLQNLRMAVVPRKPERFDEVNAMIERSPYSHIRYSTIKDGNTSAEGKPDIILGDTMGDLRKFYSLAKIVFVGRSLVPMGGSDMIETAALGKCTIFGPHTFNFKQTVDALLAADAAIEVADAQELKRATLKCFTEPEYASRIASNARNVIIENQGATKKTIKAVADIIHNRS
ncbi:3-deoxy-D-manno-octulosonic acid transferase [Anaerohalosphaera lusitana]|uniref:3-deoxy-D-manno-octulosonic acid transferase n=1 Tax=Anaerohalosphaera lusitana TaxID=1936003 RepID=A0A1U9NL60_9BACT|nr:3-deoxy-D-manno-octulosonic acid transferase [Anaerohalosphaera lusitana]AQT68673.1 3-deoxy-D-manno-octulosonic acid transferase [Anaerohalosphaera lusitana]